MEEQLQQQVSYFIGKWGWMALAAFSVMMFRSTLEGILESLKIFLGNDLNTDDVVHLNEKPARVVRVGIFKTIFSYMMSGVQMVNRILRVVVKKLFKMIG